MPQRLFAGQRLSDYLQLAARQLSELDSSAVRDEQLEKKVEHALSNALVAPVVFHREQAKFATQSVAAGGVSVTLKLPYVGDRGLLQCSTNGYVFEHSGQDVHPNRWDTEQQGEVVRLEFRKRFDSTAQAPIRAWAREVGDDCDRQAAQQAPMVAAHNKRVKETADRILAEVNSRAGEAERLAQELGEGI